ncbi:MAG: helix-turn-helix domain-containing protein [Caldimonas sp.]
MRETCLPGGLTGDEMGRIDERMVAHLKKVGRGETLFRAGDRFESLFAVWTGFFKTVITSFHGREQITGFRMGGELIGTEGIDTGRHGADAIALEDSQVCVIPFDELLVLSREVVSLQTQVHKAISHEIVTGHGVMFLLGSMYAEERVASFLLDLVHRLQARGFSPSSVVLRMSREEIGNFLGLKLETVSRTFSKFQANGLLFVRQRQVRITDPVGLQQVLDGEWPPTKRSDKPA